jgi:hypothetical protein
MVSIKYTEDGGNTQFIQQLKNPNADNIDDCCQVAKDVFNEKVSIQLNNLGTGRQKELLPDLINIENLSCDDFLRMLKSLSAINTSSGDLISATTQAIGRFIRLDKIPTSMFTVLANVVKQAGAEAHEAWIKCQEKSALNTTDSNWQNQLELSEDNKFNTWDNILLTAYKPVKKFGLPEYTQMKYVLKVLEDGRSKGVREIYDAVIDYATGLPHILKFRGTLLKASKGTLKGKASKYNNSIIRDGSNRDMTFKLAGEEE